MARYRRLLHYKICCRGFRIINIHLAGLLPARCFCFVVWLHAVSVPISTEGAQRYKVLYRHVLSRAHICLIVMPVGRAPCGGILQPSTLLMAGCNNKVSQPELRSTHFIRFLFICVKRFSKAACDGAAHVFSYSLPVAGLQNFLCQTANSSPDSTNTITAVM